MPPTITPTINWKIMDCDGIKLININTVAIPQPKDKINDDQK